MPWDYFMFEHGYSQFYLSKTPVGVVFSSTVPTLSELGSVLLPIKNLRTSGQDDNWL